MVNLDKMRRLEHAKECRDKIKEVAPGIFQTVFADKNFSKTFIKNNKGRG